MRKVGNVGSKQIGGRKKVKVDEPEKIPGGALPISTTL